MNCQECGAEMFKHIETYRCPKCGEWYDPDEKTAEHLTAWEKANLYQIELKPIMGLPIFPDVFEGVVLPPLESIRSKERRTD